MSENMIFCLGEGRLESQGEGYQKNNMVFNKAVGKEDFKEYKKQIKEILKDFELTTFVEEENMTKEEKKDNPKYKDIKGYLKVWGYKKAWENFKRKTSKENWEKLMNFPHFNAEIFKKITGIDVNKKENELVKFKTEDGEKLKLSRKSIEEIKKLKL